MDLRSALMSPGFRLRFTVSEFERVRSLVHRRDVSKGLRRIVDKAKVDYDRNRVSIRVQMFELDELFNLLLLE